MSSTYNDRTDGVPSASFADVIRAITTALGIKAPCAVATTANITLSGEQTIDGVLTSSSRVLVKDQTDASENGIYDSGASTWTRSPDFDGTRDFTEGTLVRVTGGTTAQGVWELTTSGDIALGTTDLAFSMIVSPLQGVSAFVLTLLDDTTADIFWATLMASITKNTARSALGLAINSDVEAYDADILKADATRELSISYTHTPKDKGTVTSGNFKPVETDGAMQHYINGGAHTLLPPDNSMSILLKVTNNASAGAIDTDSFDMVTGDAILTSNTHVFFLNIQTMGTESHCHVTALQ